MRVFRSDNVDVRRLLKDGDLDIRGVAETSGALPAKDYFSKVAKFIEDAPEYAKVLSGIAEFSQNVKALKELEEKLGVAGRELDPAADTERVSKLVSLKAALTEIGYNKLNFSLDSICNAIENGSHGEAEQIAADACEKFTVLSQRLKKAYITKRFARAQVKNGVDLESEYTVTLMAALDQLYLEEATRKLRILAVDDVSIILNSITSVLSPYYEVFALKDSMMVESFLHRTTPELFLLDIEMSGMNGFDLVPLIRSFEEHRDTPIIYLTGNASMNNFKDAVALGACDFITKPVKREVLLGKIEKNIVRKRAF